MHQSTEFQLIAKLVRVWHLNVPERKALPSQEAKGSLVLAAVAEVVERDGWYPSTWRPELDFDGGLIERVSGSAYIVHWKAEASMGRFEPLESQLFGALTDACSAYARRFFGGSIDGIPINWER